MQIDRECIVDLLSKILDCGRDAIGKFNNNADLQDLGLNSVNVIKLIILIEQEFKFEFDEKDLYFENLNSIGKVESLILKYKKQEMLA
jgi:acyl carrier protein